MFLTFDVELDYVGEWMELHVSVRESVNAEKHNGMDQDGWEKTYTKEFLRLIILIMRTSILSEKPIIHMLNLTSRWYFTTIICQLSDF